MRKVTFFLCKVTATYILLPAICARKIANLRKTAAICKICSFRSGFEENAVVRLHTLPPLARGRAHIVAGTVA